MEFRTSKDQMLALAGGRRYAFVEHEKPRCRFCSIVQITGGLCPYYPSSVCAPSNGRHDGRTGYWTEVTA